MHPQRITVAPAAADRNGIAEAQTAAGAGSLTPNGVLAGVLDIPRHISIYSAGNISGVVFTVTGTDRAGRVITEAITGPNATTVNGSKNFATVTEVAVDGAVGSACEVGSSDEFETQWVVLDHDNPVGTVQVEMSAGASLTWALQTTADDVQSEVEGAEAISVDGSLTGQTASARGSDTGYATAARLAVTAYVSGSLVYTHMQGIQ